jgi:hypothetical protein
MNSFALHFAIGFFVGVVSVGWLFELYARARERNIKRGRPWVDR